MLESFVLNSLHAARNSAVRSPSTHYPLKMLSTHPTPTFFPNFFTPHPRKGKAKATLDDLLDFHQDCLRPWLSDLFENASYVHSSRSKDTSSSHVPPATPSQSRSCRQPVGSRPLPSHRRYSTPRYLCLKWAEADQRRYSSSAAASTRRADHTPRDESAQRLLDTFPSNASRFDPHEAWAAFVNAEACDAITASHLDGLLELVDRLAAEPDGSYSESNTSDELTLWGQRVQTIVDFLAPRVYKQSLKDLVLQSLRARAAAMSGRFDEATALLDCLSNTNEDNPHLDDTLFVETHREIVTIMQHLIGPSQTFEWLITRWDAIGLYLAPHRIQTRANQARVAAFRQTVRQVVENIESPAPYLLERRSTWTRDQMSIGGEYLIQALSELSLPSEAIEVLEEMQRQSLKPSIPVQLILVRALVRERSFEVANTMYSTLEKSVGSESVSKRFLSTGLYLFAHQGDVKRAKEQFRLIDEKHNLTPGDIAVLLHAMAIKGKSAETVSLFQHYFPLDIPEEQLKFFKPNIVHFSEVIFAHAQRGDFDGMTDWLAKMSAYGHSPDAVVYSIILKSFAMRGDVDSIATVLAQMKTAGFPPSSYDYTTIISLLAQRKDSVAAETLYKRALDEGIAPDRPMINALMNAHVEAGSWNGVIRAFDYMMSSPNRRHRPSIVVLNTLLKAYVLIGAPFRVISNVFSRLDKVGVRPTARTFALLIQSACDAGHMDVASELFSEMDKLGERWQSDLHINVYVMTIIMAGWLRQGSKKRAKEVYDEMERRDIIPTAVTLGTIIHSYGRDKTEESLKLAEDFIKALISQDPSVRGWDRPSGARKSALETIYSPLMNVYAQEKRPEDTERLLKDMMEAGAEPSLGTLTVLLDAYRRTNNTEAARLVWPQIFQLGLRYSRLERLTGEDQEEVSFMRSPRPSNILCIPLSIYIDALSTGGYHVEIADTWRKFQMNSFAFDSHNWNHLAVALVRAGEPERAFEVLEKVILPYQRSTTSKFNSRDAHPTDPLIFDKMPALDGDKLPEPFVESPLHRSGRRSHAASVASIELKDWLPNEKDYTGDFAHPLHVLQQVSPSWSTWTPHAVTLGVLSRVITHLSSGKVIEPLKSDDEGSDAPRVLESREAINARHALAAELLRRIYAEFPNAVRAVEDHERRERTLEQHRLEVEQRQNMVWT